MQYENRQPDENFNVTAHHPLRVLVKLLALAVLGILLLVVVLNVFGSALSTRIPFHYETSLMSRLDVSFAENTDGHPMQRYLESLVQKLSAPLGVPESIFFSVHYNTEDIVNAYATLGGNLVFYRGLLQQMPNENALAMVVAHEMSHVLQRDPMAGLGGGLASALALMAITGAVGAGPGESLLRITGMLTQMSFTRRMEAAADHQALSAVARLYGHVEGADALFRLMANDDIDGGGALGRKLSQFGQTHPLDENRIADIRALARINGWPLSGAVSPLPSAYWGWLSAN